MGAEAADDDGLGEAGFVDLAVAAAGGAPDEGGRGGDCRAEGKGLVAVGTGVSTGERGDSGGGPNRSFVSSSANRWTSSYSSVSRHSGHLISFQRRLLRSVRIEVATQTLHVVGSCVQVLVMAVAGNSETGLVSVQMMHSRSPLRTSGRRRWLVITTEAVDEATWYRCPKLAAVSRVAYHVGAGGSTRGRLWRRKRACSQS